jgi:hypothetical protein
MALLLAVPGIARAKSSERRFSYVVLVVDCPLLWIGLDDSAGDRGKGELHAPREIRRELRETAFRS